MSSTCHSSSASDHAGELHRTVIEAVGHSTDVNSPTASPTAATPPDIDVEVSRFSGGNLGKSKPCEALPADGIWDSHSSTGLSKFTPSTPPASPPLSALFSDGSFQTSVSSIPSDTTVSWLQQTSEKYCTDDHPFALPITSSLPESSSRRLTTADFKPIQLLGSGSYGDAYLVQDRHSGKRLVLKIMPKAKQDVSRLPDEQVVLEHYVLRSFEGEKGFLSLVGSWHDADFWYIATEFCPYGDAEQPLANAGRIPMSVVQIWIAQTVLALEKLHSRGIVHHDIKPDNIFINENGDAVLADFGLVQRVVNSDPTLRCGTIRFFPPEVFTLSEYAPYPKDVWALGLTMFELMTGSIPFGNPNPTMEQAALAAIHEELSFRRAVDIRAAMAEDLVEQMVTKDPRQRATLAEIKAHPFFGNIDWDGLAAGTVKVPGAPPKLYDETVVDEDLCLPFGVPLLSSEDPYKAFSYTSLSLDLPPPSPDIPYSDISDNVQSLDDFSRHLYSEKEALPTIKLSMEIQTPAFAIQETTEARMNSDFNIVGELTSAAPKASKDEAPAASVKLLNRSAPFTAVRKARVWMKKVFAVMSL
ncbi:kinase-like domain-containing protein [Amylostereum chailletii]|nr:kinase-like domain-containing protein [Amylostereum chailletii]